MSTLARDLVVLENDGIIKGLPPVVAATVGRQRRLVQAYRSLKPPSGLTIDAAAAAAADGDPLPLDQITISVGEHEAAVADVEIQQRVLQAAIGSGFGPLGSTYSETHDAVLSQVVLGVAPTIAADCLAPGCEVLLVRWGKDLSAVARQASDPGSFSDRVLSNDEAAAAVRRLRQGFIEPWNRLRDAHRSLMRITSFGDDSALRDLERWFETPTPELAWPGVGAWNGHPNGDPRPGDVLPRLTWWAAHGCDLWCPTLDELRTAAAATRALPVEVEQDLVTTIRY